MFSFTFSKAMKLGQIGVFARPVLAHVPYFDTPAKSKGSPGSTCCIVSDAWAVLPNLNFSEFVAVLDWTECIPHSSRSQGSWKTSLAELYTLTQLPILCFRVVLDKIKAGPVSTW